MLLKQNSKLLVLFVDSYDTINLSILNIKNVMKFYKILFHVKFAMKGISGVVFLLHYVPTVQCHKKPPIFNPRGLKVEQSSLKTDQCLNDIQHYRLKFV